MLGLMISCVSMSAINPFGASGAGREALAEVLLEIREQADADSWEQFSDRAAAEADLEIPVSTLKKLAPSPQYGTMPSAGLFYALHQWSEMRGEPFRFANGEPISSVSLMEVLIGVRTATGSPVERRNGSHR